MSKRRETESKAGRNSKRARASCAGSSPGSSATASHTSFKILVPTASKAAAETSSSAADSSPSAAPNSMTTAPHGWMRPGALVEV
eukprot:5090241-Pleurochrysis_carterae.AAC.2